MRLGAGTAIIALWRSIRNSIFASTYLIHVKLTITCNGLTHTVSKSTFGKPYFCTVDSRGQDEQPYEGKIPEGNYYVVSIISLQAIVANGGCEQFSVKEFLAPGKLVRDAEGKIIGSAGFSIL